MDGGGRVPKKMEEASGQADWRCFPEGNILIYILDSRAYTVTLMTQIHSPYRVSTMRHWHLHELSILTMLDVLNHTIVWSRLLILSHLVISWPPLHMHQKEVLCWNSWLLDQDNRQRSSPVVCHHRCSFACKHAHVVGSKILYFFLHLSSSNCAG